MHEVPLELSHFNFCLADNNWYLTVAFVDDFIIWYKLTVGDKPVFMELGNSTLPQRGSSNEDLSCFGVKHRGELETTTGMLRGEVTVWGSLKTYVLASRAAHVKFDDEQKEVLTAGAMAIQHASAVHRAFVPPQDSWGVTLQNRDMRGLLYSGRARLLNLFKGESTLQASGHSPEN